MKKVEKERIKNIVILVLLLLSIIASVKIITLEYYRSDALLNNRSVTWGGIPYIILEFVELGEDRYFENEYLIKKYMLIGKNLESYDTRSEVHNELSIFYSALQSKIFELEKLTGKERTEEFKKIEVLLNNMKEINEEVNYEIRYNDAKNNLKFSPFRVNSSYIDKLFLEKLENRNLSIN
jgi:hypothetical protein